MAVSIDERLVRRLIDEQFPRWTGLPLQRIEPGGWDNRSFRLGDEWLVRLPRDEAYAMQVAKEQHWLPRLAPALPRPIPSPVAWGAPGAGYPWHWSIYRWIDGETVTLRRLPAPCSFALQLAQFLVALRGCDASGGPAAGEHNFHRGGLLARYDQQVREATALLADRVDADAIATLWRTALERVYVGAPCWVHGDVSPANLLVRGGNLAAVIDFGQLGVGDPACDLTIAWTLFERQSREVFRDATALDEATWARARAWAVWKGLIVAAGLSPTNAPEWSQPLRVVEVVLAEASQAEPR